jgi:leader peptidase (prepilin peptidase) / N-methyltransferase
MNAAAAVFVIPPALALGSFLNVAAVRVPLRRSLVRPRSTCASCGHAIDWRDNIPLASYVLLRGRCRHCRGPISPVYPLVETVSAGLIVGCVAVFGISAYAALAASFCAVLVVLSVIDLRHRIVPNRIILPASGALLVVHTVLDPSAAWALGAFGAAGLLFIAALAYPPGLGMGDVKLALLLGAMLGGAVSVALLVGFLASLVPALVLVARYRGAARKLAVPLVPFLSLGAVVALFWGNELVQAYLARF